MSPSSFSGSMKCRHIIKILRKLWERKDESSKTMKIFNYISSRVYVWYVIQDWMSFNKDLRSFQKQKENEKWRKGSLIARWTFFPSLQSLFEWKSTTFHSTQNPLYVHRAEPEDLSCFSFYDVQRRHWSWGNEEWANSHFPLKRLLDSISINLHVVQILKLMPARVYGISAGKIFQTFCLLQPFQITSGFAQC